MLSEKDRKVLQEIIDTDGKCLDSNRCNMCPFRSICLPEFLNTSPPSPQQRINMALAIIIHDELFQGGLDLEQVQTSNGWGQNKKIR
jgi:hypothetical protein